MRWPFALVVANVAFVVGCAKPPAPSTPRITCSDCVSSHTFATHTKIRVKTSWQGECETDVVMAEGSTKRDVCREIPNDATIACDRCVVTPLFGQTYEVALTTSGTATLRGTFKPAEPRASGTATFGPLRVAKPTRIAATCRRNAAQEVSIQVELLADAQRLGSNRPQVKSNNASCVDEPTNDRITHRYRCATPTDVPALELTVTAPDFASTVTVSCSR